MDTRDEVRDGRGAVDERGAGLGLGAPGGEYSRKRAAYCVPFSRLLKSDAHAAQLPPP